MAKVITLDGQERPRKTRADVLQHELTRAQLALSIRRDRTCLDNCRNELERFWTAHYKAKAVCREEGWGSDGCARAIDDTKHCIWLAHRMSKSRRGRVRLKDLFPPGTVFAGKKRSR